MKLYDFIRSHIEPILVEWEAFARTQGPGAASMDRLALRDHAHAMLLTIADDIENYQSEADRESKSRGEAPPDGDITAATTHGRLRFDSQFSMSQVAAEFRALRATVLRLWIENGDGRSELCDAVIRFNEAIDQALAESIDAFMLKSDFARDLFIGVLGHDMRAPLSTISFAGEALARGRASAEQVAEFGGNVKRAAYHMKCLIENVIGYARLQLGSSIPVHRLPVELSSICRDALKDMEATFRGSHARLDIVGDVTGEFDAVAVRQLMTNLFINAAQHGRPDGEIVIELCGSDTDVSLLVSNDGEPLSREVIATIFEPLVRAGRTDHSDTSRTSFGLGLYIAREVAQAHGGTLEVVSTAEGRTTFNAHLPKEGATPRGHSRTTA